MIPSSITSIDDWAFSDNQIIEVTIPDSVTSFGSNVFLFQIKPGGTSYIDFWNSDQSSQNRQALLESIIFTKIFASSNQVSALGLTDLILTEADENFDYNADGDQTDILSGQLINPARVTASYEDENGNAIAPDATYTGTGLSTYLIVDNPTNNLNLYYKQGGGYAIPAAPTISGYNIITTPSDITSLLAGNNPVTYIYKQTSNQPPVTPPTTPTTPTTPPITSTTPKTPTTSILQ